MSFVTGEGTTMPTTLTDVPLPGRVVAYAKLPCVICPGRSTNFCRPLEEQLQAELFHTVARQRWEPREFLFRRGDPAGPLFKITEGIASVSHSLPDGRRQILRFLLPGDVCGYLEENGRYSFDGQAVSEVITCSFPRKDFQRFEKQQCIRRGSANRTVGSAGGTCFKLAACRACP